MTDRKTVITGLPSDESDRTAAVAKLILQVELIVEESGEREGFDASAWVSNWIEQPAHALGGRKPRELLDTSEGRQAISKLIAQVQSGAYA